MQPAAVIARALAVGRRGCAVGVGSECVGALTTVSIRRRAAVPFKVMLMGRVVEACTVPRCRGVILVALPPVARLPPRIWRSNTIYDGVRRPRSRLSGDQGLEETAPCGASNTAWGAPRPGHDHSTSSRITSAGLVVAEAGSRPAPWSHSMVPDCSRVQIRCSDGIRQVANPRQSVNSRPHGWLAFTHCGR